MLISWRLFELSSDENGHWIHLLKYDQFSEPVLVIFLLWISETQLKHGFAGLRNTTESGQKFTTENIGKLLINIKLTTDSWPWMLAGMLMPQRHSLVWCSKFKKLKLEMTDTCIVAWWGQRPSPAPTLESSNGLLASGGKRQWAWLQFGKVLVHIIG